MVISARRRPDAYTKLFLNFNGVDAATSTVDMSRAPHAVTFAGNAAIDTAQKKFGASSVVIEDDTDYLSVADHADWNFGTGDFTIDLWVRLSALPGEDRAAWFLYQTTSGTNEALHFYYNDTGGVKSIVFTCQGTGTTILAKYTYAVNLSVDTWYHVAIVRSGATGYIFLNGNNDSSTEETAFGSNSMPDCNSALQIGRAGNASQLNGWMDGLRISKGIARWTADFTVPAAEYR